MEKRAFVNKTNVVEWVGGAYTKDVESELCHSVEDGCGLLVDGLAAQMQRRPSSSYSFTTDGLLNGLPFPNVQAAENRLTIGIFIDSKAKLGWQAFEEIASSRTSSFHCLRNEPLP